MAVGVGVVSVVALAWLFAWVGDSPTKGIDAHVEGLGGYKDYRGEPCREVDYVVGDTTFAMTASFRVTCTGLFGRRYLAWEGRIGRTWTGWTTDDQELFQCVADCPQLDEDGSFVPQDELGAGP